MLAPARSTHFSWSFKLSTFIKVNVLDVLDEIGRRDYHLIAIQSIAINYIFKETDLLAPVGSTHFSWSFKLRTFIMVNVLNVLDEISRRNYR